MADHQHPAAPLCLVRQRQKRLRIARDGLFQQDVIPFPEQRQGRLHVQAVHRGVDHRVAELFPCVKIRRTDKTVFLFQMIQLFRFVQADGIGVHAADDLHFIGRLLRVRRVNLSAVPESHDYSRNFFHKCLSF